MRHKVFGNQLGRNTKQARALYRGLVRQLLSYGRIETTLAKSKAIVPMVDRTIAFAKKNTVAARREVTKILGSGELLDKIFNEIAPRFPNRNSGYSRIIHLQDRFSDSAKRVILEIIEGVAVEPAKGETKDGKPETKNEVKPTARKTAKTKKAATKKNHDYKAF